jgi:glycosyltransferase involved in cell wall biosynthesis
MRIVEIIPQLSSGGAERFTVDLCNCLAESHHVKLIVFHSLETCGFFAGELSPKVQLVVMNKKTGFDFSLLGRLRSEVLEFRPDVVHTHLRAIMYVAPLLCRQGKIRFFHTVHSDAAKEAGRRLDRMVRRVAFKTGLIGAVTVSDESLRSFHDFYGVSAAMIYNGRNVGNPKPSPAVETEINGYRLTGNTRILVNLARLMPVKRQPMIARICKRLESEGYDFAMLFIGREESASVAEEVQSVACNSCHILGEKTTPLDYLTLADAYCLMSDYEGMPISLIEALGVGVVPVCTPVGGIVNVVKPGVNGVLAHDLSEEACYEALKSFLDMPIEQINEMKVAARQSYQPFSITPCANRYVELFAGENKQGSNA